MNTRIIGFAPKGVAVTCYIYRRVQYYSRRAGVGKQTLVNEDSSNYCFYNPTAFFD